MGFLVINLCLTRTMCRKDDSRKRKRDEVKMRKEEEKKQKGEELRRLKNLKKKEIFDKLQKIQEMSGNKSKILKELHVKQVNILKFARNWLQ
jgi:hypothetical protein